MINNTNTATKVLDIKQNKNPNIVPMEINKAFYESVQNNTNQLDGLMEYMNKASETATDCGNIINATAETLSNQMHDYMNNVYSSMSEMINKSLTCYSFTEVVNLQAEAASNYTNSTLKNIADISDLAFNFANDVQKPIQKRTEESFKIIEKSLTK